MTTFDETVDELFKLVRDAGAVDDNNGAEDWTYSDKKIDEAKAALYKAIREDVIGEDDVLQVPYDTPAALRSRDFQTGANWLRASQRQVLNPKGEK